MLNKSQNSFVTAESSNLSNASLLKKSFVDDFLGQSSPEKIMRQARMSEKKVKANKHMPAGSIFMNMSNGKIFEESAEFANQDSDSSIDSNDILQAHNDILVSRRSKDNEIDKTGESPVKQMLN